MPTLENYSDPEPHVILEEKVWVRIEKTLGLEGARPDIRVWIAHYMDTWLLAPEGPQTRPSKLGKALSQIKMNARQLLDDLDWSSDDESAEAWARAYVVVELLARSERKQLLSSLSALIERADGALQKLPPDKGGRLKKHPRLPYLIFSLANVFEEATGNRPTLTYKHSEYVYDTPFYGFVDSVLAACNYQISEQTLGKEIQKALQIWRARTGKDQT